MPVIVGLGNPGTKYTGTRHNIGFELIDRLCDSQSVALSPGKGPYYIGKSTYRDEILYLVKPTTYMNRSGEAVRHLVNWFKMDPEHCLLCYDDLDIPVGSIRVRAKGSAGGHNGIKDTILQLGTDLIPRIRIGIGNDFPKEQQVGYVLSKFKQKERELVDNALEKAEEAVYCFISEGIDEAMNNFN